MCTLSSSWKARVFVIFFLFLSCFFFSIRLFLFFFFVLVYVYIIFFRREKIIRMFFRASFCLIDLIAFYIVLSPVYFLFIYFIYFYMYIRFIQYAYMSVLHIPIYSTSKSAFLLFFFAPSTSDVSLFLLFHKSLRLYKILVLAMTIQKKKKKGIKKFRIHI